MFFDNWAALGRILVVGTLAYVGLVVLLRASGKRTLAKMNAFDFVVTVALGSTLATVLLTGQVSLAEGLLGLGLLVALQFAVAWLGVRLGGVRKAVKSQPTLLVRDGRLLEDALHAERVTRGEILQAVRATGFGGLDRVDAVVLETDGTFSVVSRSNAGSGDAYADVRGAARR